MAKGTIQTFAFSSFCDHPNHPIIAAPILTLDPCISYPFGHTYPHTCGHDLPADEHHPRPSLDPCRFFPLPGGELLQNRRGTPLPSYTPHFTWCFVLLPNSLLYSLFHVQLADMPLNACSRRLSAHFCYDLVSAFYESPARSVFPHKSALKHLLKTGLVFISKEVEVFPC